MDKSIVGKFTRQILDGMCKHYEYIVEDFSFIEGICTPWGLSKNLADGTKTSILFMKMDKGIFNENLQNEICSKSNCDKENFVRVILISEDNHSDQIQNQLNYIGNSDLLKSNSIVVDLVSRKVQIFEDNIEPIANQIASVMDKNTKVKSKRKNVVVTYTIIGMNIVMFIISALLSKSIMDIDGNVLVYLGAKCNAAIEQGEWFRLLTCMFLHGGLMHIAANMYSLYCIGPLIEELYGKYKYIVIYLVTGIIASLFSFFFSNYNAVGASGAIFGLLGVVLIFAIKERERLGKGFLKNIASVVAINLFIGLSVQGIDNFAHLGGLLSGVTLGLIIRRQNS